MRAVSSSLSRMKNVANSSSRQLHQFAKILYNQHDILITKGKGSHLEDSKGNDYIDFHGMYGAVPFGHAPEEFQEVSAAFFDGKLPMTFGAFPKDSMEELSEKLSRKTAQSIGRKAEDYQVYYNNTGAEAVEAAVKFAKQHAYKVKGIPDDEKIIVAASGNFHGRTIGTNLFHPSKKLSREGFGPMLPGVEHITWNDAEGAERLLTEKGDKVAGLIMEPIQGEGGIVKPTDEFIRAVARSTKEQDITTIADEVQSGLHRAGPFWASQLHKDDGFVPDIITSAKALGGGVYPVAAVIMTNEVADVIKPGMHGSTFGGNSFAMAVANKTLDIIEEQDIHGNVRQKASLFDKKLQELQEENPDVIIGLTGEKGGLWRGVQIAPELSTHKVAKGLMDNGVISGESGANVLRMGPALNIGEQDLLQGIERLSEGFSEISKNQNKYKSPVVAMTR